MDQDLTHNSESDSAIKSSADDATYSLAEYPPKKTLVTKPIAVDSPVTVIRQRRRVYRIQISNDDERSQKSWLMKCIILAYVASFLAHFGLVIWMAYWTFLSNPEENELILAGGEIVGVDPNLEEIQPIEIDLNAGENLMSSPSRKRVDLFKPDVDISSNIKERIGDSTISSDDIAGDLGFGDGTGGSLPGGDIAKGKNAVTKGSFTAWTTPENPKVRQSYLIIIQIKLPDKIKKYRASDLSGMILGTDTYTQRIPFEPRIHWQHTYRFISDDKKKVEPVKRPPRDRLPIKDHVTTLIIKVPGAKRAMVQDTIQIRSKLLKEKQMLKIMFGKKQ